MSVEELATPLLSKDGTISEPSSSLSGDNNNDDFFSAAADEENLEHDELVAENSDDDHHHHHDDDDHDDEAEDIITSRHSNQEESLVHNEDDDSSRWCSLVYWILHTPLLPECRLGSEFSLQIRFLKFLFVTVLGIVITHYTVLWMGWEHRHGLHLSEIWLNEGNSILLDCAAFFSVGRLYSQTLSVDHIMWISVSLLSSLYTSILPQFTFLQHSVTLYELHCTWPWQLWCFVFGLVLPVCTITIVLHVQHCRQYDHLGRKLTEMLLTLLLFLVPQIGNPSFHFRHWFAGFLFGMHANYDTWFSRATMSWLWGQYMNGLAVWGRDPTLTCAYVFHLADRLDCTDEQCSWNEFHASLLEHNDDAPNWRNCSLPNDL